MKIQIWVFILFIISASIAGCLKEEKDKEKVDVPHLPEIISIKTSPEDWYEGEWLNITAEVKECGTYEGSIRIHEEDIDAVLGPEFIWKTTRLNGGGGGVGGGMRWIGGDNFTSILEVKDTVGILQFSIFAGSEEFYSDQNNPKKYELYTTRSEWYTLGFNDTVIFEQSIHILNKTIIVDDKDEPVRFNISIDAPDNSEFVKLCLYLRMFESEMGGSGVMLHVEGNNYTYVHDGIFEEHLVGLEFWIVIIDSEDQFYTTDYYQLTEEDVP